ncbi:MAG: ParA family protein, partial [Bacteroidia bacterium]
MIILIGSQKGGYGKSTTAVNICADLANQGHDVVLVDADRQC